MKHLSIVLLLALAACTHQPKEYYEIIGNVSGVEDSTIVFLFKNEGDVGRSIASDTIIGGKFYFKVKPDSLAKDELSLGCFRSEKFPSMSSELWASAGDCVNVTGEGTLIYTWKVKGQAPEIAIWQAYLEDSRDLWNEFQRIQILETACRNKRRATSDPELRATYTRECDSLESVSKEISQKISKNELNRMKNTSVESVWLNQLKGEATSAKYNPDYPYRDEIVALYNRLTEEQKQTPEAKEVYIRLFPPQHVEAGKEMIDAELYDLQGNTHHLSELRGKHILVDFWSSGCGPCIMAIPEMGELAAEYADKLNIVSISIDTKRAWADASEKHPMTWNNWNDLKERAGIYASYEQRGIPGYTLISPDGIVLEQWMGYGKGSLRRKLEQYLKK